MNTFVEYMQLRLMSEVDAPPPAGPGGGGAAPPMAPPPPAGGGGAPPLPPPGGAGAPMGGPPPMGGGAPAGGPSAAPKKVKTVQAWDVLEDLTSKKKADKEDRPSMESGQGGEG